jgi:hypothetical protein
VGSVFPSQSWLFGTIAVAPFSGVNSSIAQMIEAESAGRGRGIL